MLARYIARRKFASLSLGRKSIHVCARTQTQNIDTRTRTSSYTRTSSLHRNRFRCAIGARSKKKQRAEILTALQPIIAFRSGDREVLVFPPVFVRCSI